MIRRIAAICVLATLYCGCGSGSRSTHADYRAFIEPVRWEQAEVLYRVHGGNSEARRAVRRGFGRWDEAIQGYIRLREAQDGEQEHITARFVRIGSLGGSFIGHGTVARRRTVPVSSGGVMSSALIEFDSQLAIQFGQLERLAAHELGHCLFAQGRRTGGHSPHPSDLMYANPGVARPSGADTNTFRLAYGGVK